MISIALCTYNGEKYIKEQLNSILHQTIIPDEIIICDDFSTDNSILVIQEFIVTNNTLNIKLFINESNLGYVKNFQKCIDLCAHDYIFLSDQDDVWLPNKVERIIHFFNNNKTIDTVFTNATLVDENLNSLNKTMIETLNFENKFKIIGNKNYLFKKLLNDYLVTGATICFRKNQVKNIIPFPTNKFQIHDGWIGLIVSFQNKLAYLDECLIKYRQHPQQSVGAKIKFYETQSLIKKNRFTYFSDLYTNPKYYQELIASINSLEEMNELLINAITTKNILSISNQTNYKYLIERKNYFKHLKTLNKNRILRFMNSVKHKRNILPFIKSFRSATSFFFIELIMKVPDVRS